MADIAPLRTSRDFRVLFASRTVTLFGSQATEVALLVQARQRFSLWSGGVICVAAVALTCAALPGFLAYRSSRASETARWKVG
jgi:hypothetical protein